MLAITPQMRILVAVEAVDFRKGIDSLAELCRAKLEADPFSGCLFVFRSRRATSIKVLVYDGQGFWLATKRLSKGRFRWWPQRRGSRHGRCACIKRRCCWRQATRTSMRRRCGAKCKLIIFYLRSETAFWHTAAMDASLPGPEHHQRTDRSSSGSSSQIIRS